MHCVPAIDPQALRTAMDLAGFSPERLAEKLGISAHYVRNVRNGHRTLERNPELRKEIAKALDVPVRWLEVADGEQAAAS